MEVIRDHIVHPQVLVTIIVITIIQQSPLLQMHQQETEIPQITTAQSQVQVPQHPEFQKEEEMEVGGAQAQLHQQQRRVQIPTIKSTIHKRAEVNICLQIV